MNTRTGTARNASVITVAGTRTHACSDRRPIASTKPSARLSTAASAKARSVFSAISPMDPHTAV